MVASQPAENTELYETFAGNEIAADHEMLHILGPAVVLQIRRGVAALPAPIAAANLPVHVLVVIPVVLVLKVGATNRYLLHLSGRIDDEAERIGFCKRGRPEIRRRGGHSAEQR